MERSDAHDLDLIAVTLVSDKKTPAYTGTQIDREAPRSESDFEVRFLITDDVDEVQEAIVIRRVWRKTRLMNNIIYNYERWKKILCADNKQKWWRSVNLTETFLLQ